MHVGNLPELKNMTATQIKSTVISDAGHRFRMPVKMLQHSCCLFAAYHFEIRPDLLKIFNPSGMIRLHMVDDQVINGPGVHIQFIQQIIQMPGNAVPSADSVHNRRLLSFYDI